MHQAMGSAPDPGFVRVLEPRAFRFPEDHGVHPEDATEWWYLASDLRGGTARRLSRGTPGGLQLAAPAHPALAALVHPCTSSSNRWTSSRNWSPWCPNPGLTSLAYIRAGLRNPIH